MLFYTSNVWRKSIKFRETGKKEKKRALIENLLSFRALPADVRKGFAFPYFVFFLSEAVPHFDGDEAQPQTFGDD